jgi:hypothetical protein
VEGGSHASWVFGPIGGYLLNCLIVADVSVAELRITESGHMGEEMADRCGFFPIAPVVDIVGDSVIQRQFLLLDESSDRHREERHSSFVPTQNVRFCHWLAGSRLAIGKIGYHEPTVVNHELGARLQSPFAVFGHVRLEGIEGA